MKKENMAIEALKNGGTVSPDTAPCDKTNVYEKIAGEISNMKKRGMKVN